MRRRLSKPAISQFVLHVTAASFLASIIVVIFSQWWVFDLFSHFRIQYVLAGFLLLPIFLWLRKYWVATAILSSIIFHSFALWPYLQSSRVMASSEEPYTVTLLFANIYYKDPDFEKILTLIDHEDPDVMVFAELSEESFSILKALIGPKYVFTGFEEGKGAYDISYFSKQEPELAMALEFTQGNPSILLRYQVDGQSLSVLGIHPHSPVAAHSTEERDLHLEAALAYAASTPGPITVLGDFNISQFSPKFPKLLKKYGLVDTQLEFGLQPSWHANSLPVFRIPIDQVVVSQEVEVYDRYIGQPTGSDHLPVIVKVGVQ